MTPFWKQDIQFLKQVGPQKAKTLKQVANIHTFEDLLFYFPRRYLDRSNLLYIRDLDPSIHQEPVALIGKFSHFQYINTSKGKKILTARLYDEKGYYVPVQWFKISEWMLKFLQEPQRTFLIYAKPEWMQGKPIFTHPEIEKLETENYQKILPIYPGSEALSKEFIDNRFFRKIIQQLLDLATNEWYEPLPSSIVQQYSLLSREQAAKLIHFPETIQDAHKAKYRFQMEEMLSFLFLVNKRKVALKQNEAPIFHVVGENFLNFYHHHLPFELTNAQKRVIKEIRRDLKQPVQMNRLVQGDVGSGKTLVALMVSLIAIDNGYQVALMAPTEILAEQHYNTFHKLLAPLNIHVALLTGSTASRQKQLILNNLLNNHLKILIGTHALIEDYVQFANLGLTIIDEQHKFGVEQRAKLWNKNTKQKPHHLVMTATPIPRTLAMTLYGDLDVSTLNELPKGRMPIKTQIITEPKRLQMYGFIKQQLQEGRQAYFVYPLIEESQKLDLIAVKEGYEAIQRSFPNVQVGIVHGKMTPEDKDKEMQKFKQKITKILVATTVIEVGIDVPNATVIVIENAERFGLSQLHQLRGRVGRGSFLSYCFLVPSKLNPTTQKRLKALEDYSDGFKISEIDLEIRGPGEFLGTRQSGIPDFRTVNVATDLQVIQNAKIVLERLQNEPKENLNLFFKLVEFYQQQLNLQFFIA